MFFAVKITEKCQKKLYPGVKKKAGSVLSLVPAGCRTALPDFIPTGCPPANG